MSNVKLFDAQHSNDELQNDLNINLFDIRHSNVKFKLFDVRYLNVKQQTDLNVKLFAIPHSNVKCPNECLMSNSLMFYIRIRNVEMI